MKEKRFSGLLDSSAVIVEFRDNSKMTGYSSNELIGKNWFEVFIPDGDLIEMLEVFSGLFYSSNQHWVYENDLICKDGTKKTFHFNNNILKDSLDRPEYIYFTAKYV